MAYIGKTPVIGNFVKLDSITAVNGQAAYTMQNGGANFTSYDNVNQFLVSLNGILQSPTDSFTVSGSTLTFASNLSTGDVIDFVLVLGNSLDIGTPSDNTISTAKLQANAVTSAKLGTDVALGKVLQVIQASDSTARDTTSTSFTDVGTLSVSITPSSTSNKVLVLVSTNGRQSSGGDVSYFTIDRNGTNISPTTTNGFANIQPQSGAATDNISITYLDSPSSTSALTYKLQFRSNTGSATTTANWNATTGTITVMEISA